MDTWVTDRIIDLADAAEQRLDDDTFDRQIIVEDLIHDLRNLARDAAN